MTSNTKKDLKVNSIPIVSSILLFLSCLSYYYSISYGVVLCLVLLSFAICFFKDEVAFSVGIFIFANNMILAFAFFMQNGIISYLWNGQFDQYYIKVLFLESMFWGVFLIGCGNMSGQTGSISTISKKNSFKAIPPALFLFIGIPLLISDILISSSSYFISYVEFSSTGTVAYEAGAAFVAFNIFLRIGKKVSTRYLLFEALAILLILYIAIGSGKRLPLAYPIFSYIVWISYQYGRPLAGLVYSGIAISGYIFGIVRDAMVLQTVSLDNLISGLKYTNQGATLHASAVYVRIVDEDLISIADRFVSLVSNFFLAIFVSVSSLPDVARINEFAMNYYGVQGNGGLIGAYSYFFLGWVGPFIFSSILVMVYRSKGPVAALFFGFLAVLSPRWTLYNIAPALRILGLVGALIFLLVIFNSQRNSSKPRSTGNFS